jgi:hypothetical protein
MWVPMTRLFVLVTSLVLRGSDWNLTAGIQCSANRCTQCTAGDRTFSTPDLVAYRSSGRTANSPADSCIKRGIAGIGYCRSTNANRHKNERSYHEPYPI